MTEQGTLYVISAPALSEQEGEFNRWYDKVHLGEVAGSNGFVSARRFVSEKLPAVPDRDPDADAATESQGSAEQYIAVHENEFDSVVQCSAGMFGRVAAGELNNSDALQSDPPPEVPACTVGSSRRW